MNEWLFLLLTLVGFVQNPDHVVLPKSGATITYNHATATPYRVDWTLSKETLHKFDRAGVSFEPDLTLPAGWYVVHSSDYTGTGYDRGHLWPSADGGLPTFIMSNVAPQAPLLNRESWEHLEAWCRTKAESGATLAISAGVGGNSGTIANGKITVPSYFWKIIKLSSDTGSRTIYAVFPNVDSSGGVSWPSFVVSEARFIAETGVTQ